MRACFFILIGGLVAGCQSLPDLTNLEYTRKRAANLIPKVSEMRIKREAELNQINERYRQTFAALMEDLGALNRRSLLQQNYSAAQSSADAIQMDWESRTLKSEMHVLFARDLDAEMSRVDAIHKALADARSAYVDSYQEAALKLGKLKEVESGLRTLSESTPLSKDTIKFFEALVEAAKKAEEEENEPQTKNN